MTGTSDSVQNGGPTPRSGLRRLILALLLPDVLSWIWIGTVMTLVLGRRDVSFSSNLLALALITIASLATGAIARDLIRLRQDDANDDTLRTPAIVSTVAAVALWGCAFGLSFIARIVTQTAV